MDENRGNSRKRPGTGAAGRSTIAGPATPPAHDGLSAYLKEAGRVPLLDWRREAELARGLARSRRALKSLARRIARDWGRKATSGIDGWPRARQPWTLEDVDRFVEDVVGRSRTRRDAAAARVLQEVRSHKRRLDDCRDQLILANLRLVVHIAKKYPHPAMSLPDLVQEGNLGLMKAVDKFDHTRGNRFTTYAYWWIKQAVERAIGNQARTVRVPVHVQDKLRRIHRSSENLRNRQRREPTTEEIARQSGLAVAKVQEIMCHAGPTDPLEDPDRVLDHLDRQPDRQAACPFEQAVNGQRRRKVEEALKPLSQQERNVIRLRFGLGCEMRPSLKAVGDTLDLSRERVRQIERQALAKLASGSRSRALVAYLHNGQFETAEG